jgi:hypothetical protein
MQAEIIVDHLEIDLGRTSPCLEVLQARRLARKTSITLRVIAHKFRALSGAGTLMLQKDRSECAVE